MNRSLHLVILAAAIPIGGCVKGTPIDTGELIEQRPPLVERFSVAQQGWCGECFNVTVEWLVSDLQPDTKVLVTITLDGELKKTFEGPTGPQTVEVCAETSGEGATGEVALTVTGLSPSPEPIPLQQSYDGEIRTLTFNPTCPFVDAWEDTSFSKELFPAEVRVDRILNWTWFDTNQNDVKDPGEVTQKIKVSHAPELDEIIAQENWTDIKVLPTLHGTWKGVPENPPAFGDRCMEEGDVPSADFAIPLQAKVGIKCVQP